MTRAKVVAQARQVLSVHARSFRWGGAFLPPKRLDDAAIVYALCRLLDDTADEAPSLQEAKDGLDILQNEIEGVCQPRPLVQEALAITTRAGQSPQPWLELIKGMRTDLELVRCKDDQELLTYAYRVAGTVGLLMCAVLGVSDKKAWAHAIDLGVGMQLTNICRDVAEDAAMGRVYLPATRLEDAGGSQQALLDGDPAPGPVRKVVGDLLDLADEYYLSADQGIAYLPRRSRIGILVASRVYHGIGTALRHRACDPLPGRTIVGWKSKMGRVGAALVSGLRLRQVSSHRTLLHTPLTGLYGVETGE